VDPSSREKRRAQQGATQPCSVPGDTKPKAQHQERHLTTSGTGSAPICHLTCEANVQSPQPILQRRPDELLQHFSTASVRANKWRQPQHQTRHSSQGANSRCQHSPTCPTRVDRNNVQAFRCSTCAASDGGSRSASASGSGSARANAARPRQTARHKPRRPRSRPHHLTLSLATP